MAINNPLVSVCIPSYNNPDGLKKTLQNITAEQSYKNLEIIISDDASPDPTVWEVIQSFSINDRRIRTFRQKTNLGPEPNYQFVFEKANGEYFMFAQNDDQWSDQFIEKLVDTLEKSPNAPAAISNVRYINTDSQVLSPIHTLENISIYNAIGNGEIGFVFMGMWRRDMYQKYMMRTPPHIIGADHIIAVHAMIGSGSKIPIIHSELYIKGYKDGCFEWCFDNDKFYSFRTWSCLMKTLLYSPHIPMHRKFVLPLVGFTNLLRACAVTGAQIVLKLPDNNLLKRALKKYFFGAN